MEEESLEERMNRDIYECHLTGCNSNVGLDNKGNPVRYCTYYFPESLRNPVECRYKGKLVEIKKNVFTKMTYFKCYRRRP